LEEAEAQSLGEEEEEFRLNVVQGGPFNKELAVVVSNRDTTTIEEVGEVEGKSSDGKIMTSLRGIEILLLQSNQTGLCWKRLTLTVSQN
jgi:hypothetical protein